MSTLIAAARAPPAGAGCQSHPRNPAPSRLLQNLRMPDFGALREKLPAMKMPAFKLPAALQRKPAQA